MCQTKILIIKEGTLFWNSVQNGRTRHVAAGNREEHHSRPVSFFENQQKQMGNGNKKKGKKGSIKKARH